MAITMCHYSAQFPGNKCHSATDQRHSGPGPQATNCQGATVSGPAQPLANALALPAATDCQGATVSGPAQPLANALALPAATNCQGVTLVALLSH